LFWVLGGLVGWVVAAGAVGVIAGRSIRVSDGRSVRTGEDLPLTTADLPFGMRASATTAAPSSRPSTHLYGRTGHDLGIDVDAAKVALLSGGRRRSTGRASRNY
jgi:hypothetical protein